MGKLVWPQQRRNGLARTFGMTEKFRSMVVIGVSTGDSEPAAEGRVEMWRGRFPSRSSFCWPPRIYVSVPLLAHGKNPRFHFPLIEPDMQISRIRLSDKISRLRPRLLTPPHAQTYEPKVPV